MNHLVATYGYLIVALFVGAESFGVPLPGETVLIVAAGLFSTGAHPKLSVVPLWVVAAAAAVVGDNIGYLVGRTGGFRLLRRYGRVVRVGTRELKVARYLFDRNGTAVVFLGRFVSVLRTYAAFLAGVARMRWRPFALANALGGVVWSGVYVWGAHLAYRGFERASGTAAIALGVVAAVAVVAGIVVVRRRYARLAARAEAAYPDALG